MSRALVVLRALNQAVEGPDLPIRLRQAVSFFSQQALTVLRCSPLVEVPITLAGGANPHGTPGRQLGAMTAFTVDTNGNTIDPVLTQFHEQPNAQETKIVAQCFYQCNWQIELTPSHLCEDPGLRAVTQFVLPQLTTSQVQGPSIPVWMAPVNLTPDSFSDAGRWQDDAAIDTHIDTLLTEGGHILDVGGESVRPGATPVAPEDEWARIEPFLTALISRRQSTPLFPHISVDTRHVLVAERALTLGVDGINDVTGLTDPLMRALAKNSDATFFVMHSLVIPPDPTICLPHDANAVDTVTQWITKSQSQWDQDGLDLNRIVVDPGICFGKSRHQSQALMRSIPAIRSMGHRILIGHSRKGFTQALEALPPAQRDFGTLAASLAMAEDGVDMLRVHNVPLHREQFASVALDRPSYASKGL